MFFIIYNVVTLGAFDWLQNKGLMVEVNHSAPVLLAQGQNNPRVVTLSNCAAKKRTAVLDFVSFWTVYQPVASQM